MIMNLPNLHADVKCAMLSTCNGVQCCVKSPELRRNYQVHFSIDYCSQSLFIQIEKVFYTKALHDLRWGIYLFKYNISIWWNISIWSFYMNWMFLSRRTWGVQLTWNIQSQVSCWCILCLNSLEKHSKQWNMLKINRCRSVHGFNFW